MQLREMRKCMDISLRILDFSLTLHILGKTHYLIRFGELLPPPTWFGLDLKDYYNLSLQIIIIFQAVAYKIYDLNIFIFLVSM